MLLFEFVKFLFIIHVPVVKIYQRNSQQTWFRENRENGIKISMIFTPLNNHSNNKSLKKCCSYSSQQKQHHKSLSFLKFFVFFFSHLGENYQNTPVAFSEGCFHPQRIPQQGTLSCVSVTVETQELLVFSFCTLIFSFSVVKKKKRNDNFMQKRINYHKVIFVGHRKR